MAWILPEVVLRKVIAYGMTELRKNDRAFHELFSQYSNQELIEDYGPGYVEEIQSWFMTTKIPVIQAWSLNAQRIPCISVHLAQETEDESKASMGDFWGNVHGDDIGTGVFTVSIDVGLHANKAGDHVLWLYYITSYILFKYKWYAESLGLRLHTFSASDYDKNKMTMMENVWTRWIRFRCTVENAWVAEDGVCIEDVNTDPALGLEPASSVFSTDVPIEDINITENKGIALEDVVYDNDDDMC